MLKRVIRFHNPIAVQPIFIWAATVYCQHCHILGHPLQDGRGRHMNRPHSLPEEAKQVVISHIQSFKGRT